MQNERRFYVYIHRRQSDGRIFYVGKGCHYRHSTTNGRNKYWHRVARKHGWYWEILHSSLPECCAHSIEKMLISALKPMLVNVTDGGEGVSGLKHTAAAKRKMVENRKPGFVPYWSGKKMPDALKAKFRAAKLGKAQSPEHAAKSRTAKLGKPQPQSAKDATRRIKSRQIQSGNGEIFPSAAEAARKLSERLSVNCSQGNISMAATGRRNTAYGLTWAYTA